ncbi:MAG: protein phosphatase CheZ [Alphaproteobacteria bacterium]|uniref:Protein phosphatase CheZ n=1 Tax=Candidatus Nitrobium versatile TaxID=2884831 RepID=A0A953J4V0_9BACT|nr:protein phosphatase CheZ [Candidatus Nitrobium versatile]
MQYIGFTMNANEYTIPILKVQEIVNLPQLTKLPRVPDYIEGITNLRGRIIPVVNLKKLIGLYGGDSVGEKVIVVTSGRITFGVLVDGITGVISIDESEIEPPTDFNTSDIVSGVAKVNDKLIVLLETKKLIPMEDMSLFEDEIFEVKETDDDKVEVMRKIEGMGGEIMVKEVMDVKQFFEKKGLNVQDPRYAMFDEMITFMNAIASQDYERADAAIQNIMSKGQGDIQGELFKEVGKVTRKLHDSIRSFKEALDPKLRGLAEKEMPNAIDRLQFVIEKTEEAANKTMGIVEKYTLSMDDLASHIRNIKEPDASVSFLKNFKNSLEDDLTEILTTQSFQDLTGQTIKKVITLVGEIESELVKMITTFGVKIEQGAGSETMAAEKVSQEDVDDLLKDFGF